MKRRTFLTGTAAGGVAAALPAPAIAQDRRELKLVTSWPKGFPGLGTSAVRLAQRIGAATDGRLTVRVFAGGELVHPLKCNDAVQQGVADMYHSFDYYYGLKAAAYLFFTSVPFGLTAGEMDAWIQWGGGQKLWDEVGAEFGIKHLPAGNTGAQMGGWFIKPVAKAADFKGLRIQMPGLGGTVINALGGRAATMSGADILPALQAGTLDAAEWVGPWNDLAFGFHKVAKNYYYPGFHEPGAMISAGISQKAWASLSLADRAVIEAACLAENNRCLAEFNANNARALTTLTQRHGVQVRQFDDATFKQFGAAAKDVLATAGAADPLSKKIYASFMAFRRQAVTWTRLSDQTYTNKRALTPF